MLKMIIADDERIIRETIFHIIDWKKYDIEVIGLCKNGFETYDMILDENPDIVLTDIKMPGMDGLELIRRISKTDLAVQFIILSGYGEFEYAKAAMSNGVRHYLLKPCNEMQIIHCIEECKKDCCQRKLTQQITSDHFTAVSSMQHNIMFSIINDSVCQNRTFSEIKATYESYIDFGSTPYRLYYVYFLQFQYLEDFLEEFSQYCSRHLPKVTVHGIYVTNTLLLFFQNYSVNYQQMELFIRKRYYAGSSVSLETESCLFSCLRQLLSVVLEKVRKFGSIYYINNFHPIYTCNYNTNIREAQSICQAVQNGSAKAFEQLPDLFGGIDDISFLKQLSSNFLLKLTLSNPELSTIQLTEWLMAIEQETDILALKNTIIGKITDILRRPSHIASLSPMTQQIYDYVEHHLQDSNLTLKYISEHHLYMNVDYVSKKFLKETGVRFSAYLTDIRIQRAKQLLASDSSGSIQNIAEQVGLGNNPQYFSQVFKKKTGMTPTVYLSRICKKHDL
jgi:two-component system response regulator YesN